MKIFLQTRYFFFQAEDGIRDLTVTGVQTCALPISNAYGLSGAILGEFRGNLDNGGETLTLIKRGLSPQQDVLIDQVTYDDDLRSEERRVGKECRSQRSQYHCKRNPYH